MRVRKVCPNGHVFYKTPGCSSCPRCEAERRPKDGFLAELAAPARRALEGAGLMTLAKLARRSEAQLMQLHGIGPNAITKLRASLEKEGLKFRQV
jgi:predicted RecB family nuclease